MATNYYKYDPSMVVAVIFAALYIVTCIVTIFQYLKLRCWFWLFMVIASIMESVGYTARVNSVKNRSSSGPFIIQFLLIFLAPAVIAASCYMAMGRLILYVTPTKFRNTRSLWITPRFMTPIFVTCDAVAFIVQVIGGIQATGDNPSKKTLGYNVMKIGVSIQLVCFGLFLVISFRFHLVAKRFRDSWPDHRWVTFLWAINVASSLIFIRSVYRLIEFISGFDGYLSTHEWNFYVFEAAVIFPIFIMFNVFHPAKYLSNTTWRQKGTEAELQILP